MKTRVLLAEDHIMLREALKKLLEPLCEVVGTASDGLELLAMAEKLRPDVVVADIHMPHLNGLDACERLLRKLPESKIIFLTVNEDGDTAKEAVRLGALGYIVKSNAASELFKAIQSVILGRVFVTPSITTEPISLVVSRARSREHRERLTFKQREVLKLLAEGKTMKESADVLKVTPRTVAFHKIR